MRGPLLAALAVAAAASCRTPPPRLREIPTYRSAELASVRLRRVVMPPFEDEARAGPARPGLQEAFAQEFEKSTSIEVVALDSLAAAEASRGDRPRRTGQYRLESILELALRHDADGVLFGTITSYRPYTPQKLGLRIDLVSTETGAVLWSAHSEFDMSDDDARAALEASYQKYAARNPQSLSWDHALSSPGRFASLVSAEAVATLRAR